MAHTVGKFSYQQLVFVIDALVKHANTYPVDSVKHRLSLSALRDLHKAFIKLEAAFMDEPSN
jgi:hypothetical protein